MSVGKRREEVSRLVNKVLLIGRTTRDIEVKYSPNKGTPFANFNLAIARNFLSKEGEREADFIPVTVWGKLAGVCAEHLKKGSLIAIEGRIQVRNYEIQGGERRKAFDVVGENIKFLTRSKNQGVENNTAEIGFSIAQID